MVAEEVVAPPADPAADAGPELQSAIDRVAGLGGGVVFVASGRYRLASPITVREGVTVRGDRPKAANEPGVVKGTLMMPIHGRGEEDGAAAFTIERGSGVRDLTVWYPEQTASDIVPYPWTFRGSTEVAGDNYTVKNVTLTNSYQAVKIGPEWNELHTLRDVYGTALRCGFWCDMCTDIGRVTDVSFGPEWWEASGLSGAPVTADEVAGVRAFMAAEGIGIDMGRSDWEYLYGITVTGYGVGVKFRQGDQGTTNAVLYAVEALDCGTGLLVEALNGIGVAATGCVFEGSDLSVHAPPSLTNTVVQLNSCTLGGTPRNNILLEGRATVTAMNCTLSGSREAAVAATAGRISVLGCDFETGGVDLTVGENLELGRIRGNSFAKAPTIENAAPPGRVQIVHTGIEFESFDPPRPMSPPDPRPATDALFVVTDFGASPDSADNTAAFAEALTAAADAGGGIVYVPAGNYFLSGDLTVPTGVEARGCFDVPHHTVSGGSVLMPTGGRGEEEGTPFISLESDSGLRGLTFWYPEQDPRDIQPHPWTIRTLGTDCWLIDLALGNAYQGADLWTNRSDRRLVRYYSGGFFRRGLYVSKSEGGVVENVQYNPHYMFRIPPSLPNPGYSGDAWPLVCDDFVRGNLDGMVFGSCKNELLLRNFLYAAHDGLVFREDGGEGASGVVINHGTDTGSRCLVLEAVGDEGLTLFSTQLVPLGKFEIGAIIVEDSFDDEVALV